MKSTAATAVVVMGLMCGSAVAGEMIGGAAEAGPNTTATIHCEKMSGAQRDACLREFRAGTGATRGGADIAAPQRSPDTAKRTDNPVGATGNATGEISSGRSDIQSGSAASAERRAPAK